MAGQVWLTLAVSLTGIIAIPALILTVRIAMKWTRIEERQTSLISSVEKLAVDSDKRLRWLEENLWSRRR